MLLEQRPSCRQMVSIFWVNPKLENHTSSNLVNCNIDHKMLLNQERGITGA